MTLDKFINNVRSEVAKRFDLKTDAEIDAFFIDMGESAKDNQEALEKRDKMLRDAVAELCEAKRLLKAAVEDFQTIDKLLIDTMDSSCAMFNHMANNCPNCPMNALDTEGKCKWRYTDEALKLIRKDDN